MAVIRLAIIVCMALGAGLPALAPATQNNTKKTPSVFVGTWLLENKKVSGLKVRISEKLGKLNIQVSYLGTYGEYKPWPHETTLVTFRDANSRSSTASHAMASWRIDDPIYETWILKPEKKRLRIEMYTKFTDGRLNVSDVEYFKKSK